MPKDIDYYRAKIFIDKNSLDDEVIRQPQLYFDVAEQYALANSRKDEAYEYRKQAMAEAYRELKEEADKKKTKLTVDQLKQAVEIHELVVAAREAERIAQLEAERWLHLKDTFNQRSFMMRALADLYQSSYFEHSSVNVRDLPIQSNTLQRSSAAEGNYDTMRQRMAAKRKQRYGKSNGVKRKSL